MWHFRLNYTKYIDNKIAFTPNLTQYKCSSTRYKPNISFIESNSQRLNNCRKQTQKQPQKNNKYSGKKHNYEVSHDFLFIANSYYLYNLCYFQGIQLSLTSTTQPVHQSSYCSIKWSAAGGNWLTKSGCTAGVLCTCPQFGMRKTFRPLSPDLDNVIGNVRLRVELPFIILWILSKTLR